jgi:hypothetical protein
MKQHNRMVGGLFGVLLGLGAVSTAFASSSYPLAVKTFKGIPYVSGGVGANELATLRHMSEEDNLHLIFAAKNRDYLANVEVQIADTEGHRVLKAFSPGPLFFTKLPAGQYTVRATALGRPQGAVVEVPAKGQARAYLTWSNSILKNPARAVAHK